MKSITLNVPDDFPVLLLRDFLAAQAEHSGCILSIDHKPIGHPQEWSLIRPAKKSEHAHPNVTPLRRQVSSSRPFNPFTPPTAA